MYTNVKEYFKLKTDNLSFIQLKPNSDLEINGYKIKEETPLPIVIDELVNEIKEKRAQEEIKITSVIRGIIYTIGVDPEFKFNNEYKKILYNYKSDIEEYILYKGVQLIKDDFEEGLIYLRSLIKLNEENVEGLYNYGFALEEKAKKLYKNKEIKKGNIFFKKSTELFETIIDIDPDYVMAYYKLGFHYMNAKQFKKAQIMWEKFLHLNEEENLNAEVTEALVAIEDDVTYEEGYSEILGGNIQKGLKKLIPLKEKYSDWWNLLFMIGLGYRQVGEYSKAIKEFENVLIIKPEQVDTLNELGLSLANVSKFKQAIQKFTEALKLKTDDHELLCNRGMCYLQIDDIDNASKDINKANRIKPYDEVTIACKRELERIKNRA
ncbi:MAG: tetratricopeptide repeat protein [Firmicutes bacterium]|nr:tetratricopeptide repeat protein [Bacillota bacterium]